MRPVSDAVFRERLTALIERSGLSKRALSAAMGRDAGYVAALLDPDRPSRARPTPADLLAASDATGIPLVDWLHELWAIDPGRLAAELQDLGISSPLEERLAALTPGDRKLVLSLIDSLRAGKQ